uniref:Uncharacterized protein n=1 Tax=mine drainage metagenome TaxID=410659 RepID=E6QW89_9ZZZZ
MDHEFVIPNQLSAQLGSLQPLPAILIVYRTNGYILRKTGQGQKTSGNAPEGGSNRSSFRALFDDRTS